MPTKARVARRAPQWENPYELKVPWVMFNQEAATALSYVCDVPNYLRLYLSCWAT